jgi:hypothetical protein
LTKRDVKKLPFMHMYVLIPLGLIIVGFPGCAFASDDNCPDSLLPPYSLQENASAESAEIPAEDADVVVGKGSDPLHSDNEVLRQGAHDNVETLQSHDYRPPEPTPAAKPGIRWKPLLSQMLLLTTIEHGMRMTEEKTRAKLSGPFFADWRESVGNLSGWSDHGKFFANYIAHPMQGATAAYIYKNNDTRYQTLTFDAKDKKYWSMTGLALVFSTVQGLQFEIGPYSEASFGNVGQEKEIGYSKMAWIDIVISPTIGTAWMVGEDALDKYLIQSIERRYSDKLVSVPTRILLNPIRSFSNLLRFKSPSFRDDRR